MGNRYQIPYQYLLPYGRPPTPQVPKYFVIASAHFAIMHQFAIPTYEVEHMPGKYLLAPIDCLFGEKKILPNQTIVGIK